MTWLFTQVWLWSLAAFLLGSAATWLLLVLPARRRIAALAERNAILERYFDQRRDHDQQHQDQPRPARTSFDLLPSQQWEQDESRGDEDRRAMPEPAAVTQTFPAAQSPETAQVTDAAEHEEQPKPESADDSDLRLEEQREVSKLTQTAEVGKWPEVTKQSPAPTAPPELDLSGTEGAGDEEDISTSSSTWFQKKDLTDPVPGGEWTGTLDGSSAQPKREANGAAPASPQLGSLFEPLPGDDEPDAAPYAPPVGAEVTQSISREALAEEASKHADADQTRDSGDKASEAETSVQPADEDTSEPASASSAAQGGPPPLPRRTPGASPMATGKRNQPTVQIPRMHTPTQQPAEDYVVKGNYASKQYHTPDSPQYDRVAAEVWFRTASEAEQAGFAPWDGWHRD